jgi:genome maintenance exonuclease 1
VLDGTEMPHVKLGFTAAQKVLDKSVGNVVLQECPLYSDYLRLAGRVDLVAEFDGVLSIVDFKTSTRVKTIDDISNYFIQASFYAAAFYERTGIPIHQIVIVIVVDGKSEPLVFKDKPYDWLPELIKVREEYRIASLFR